MNVKLDSISQVLSAFHLSVGNSLSTILTILIGWALYIKFMPEVSNKKNDLRSILENLYSPAHALLLAKSGNKIEAAIFTERFKELLILHIAKVPDQPIRRLFEEWLLATEDLKLVISELKLKVALGSECERISKRINGWDTDWLYLVDWMLRAISAVSILSFGINIIISGLKLPNSWSRLVYEIIVIVVIIALLGAVLGAVHIRTRVRTKKLRKQLIRVDS